MKHIIFTVLDHQAKAHIPPFFYPQEGLAVRAFTDYVNDPEHPWGKHPEDYTLLSIGEYDEETADILPFDVPIVYGVGVKFLKPTD